MLFQKNIAWDGEEKSEGGSELVMLERGEGETVFEPTRRQSQI